jgi:UDP-glucose 4-epimerase
MTIAASVTPHLVLGGNGFVARHVAVLLAREGHDVVLASRTPPTWAVPSDTAGRLMWRRFEFASADWEDLIARSAVIHHYVWTSVPASANANPSGDLNINVASTISLLEEMRRQPGKRLIFASSGGTVYGQLHELPVTEAHPFHPITAYGAGKASAELYLNLYRSMHGLDCRIARISNPFGAGQNVGRGQGAATTFLTYALANRPIAIWGDGEVVRDYVHIADVAAALIKLAIAPDLHDYNIFNIGSGVGLSLNQVIAEIERQLGRAIAMRREPPRPFDLPASILNISLAKRVLDWSPRLSFPQGMRRTINDLSRKATLSELSLS